MKANRPEILDEGISQLWLSLLLLFYWKQKHACIKLVYQMDA